MKPDNDNESGQMNSLAETIRPFVFEHEAGPAVSWVAVMDALGFQTIEDRSKWENKWKLSQTKP